MFGAAVGPSTAVGKSRDLVALTQFAAASAKPADFAVRFSRGGSASKEHCAIMKDLQTVTADLGRPASVEDMHELLRHFVLIRFEALHEGSTEDPIPFDLDVESPDYQEGWADELEMYHNPNALLPIDEALFPGVTHFRIEEGEAIWRGPSPRVLFSWTATLDFLNDKIRAELKNKGKDGGLLGGTPR